MWKFDYENGDNMVWWERVLRVGDPPLLFASVTRFPFLCPFPSSPPVSSPSLLKLL